MVISGWPVPLVTGLYSALTLLGVVLAYAWIRGVGFAPAAILVGLPLLWVLLTRYVKYRENKS